MTLRHPIGPAPELPPPNWRPQPVLAAAGYALVVEILGLLIAFGVEVTAEQRVGILGTVAAAGTLLGVLFAWRAARKVTPLADPRDDGGVRLVPVDQLEQRGR